MTVSYLDENWPRALFRTGLRNQQAQTPMGGIDKINKSTKVVFTKTLEESEWDSTSLAKGDLVDEITKLKAQAGQDIIAYSGATFVAALIKPGLVDEFHSFINPIAISNGMPIFDEFASKQMLTLLKATAFAYGIVVLNCVKRSE